MICSQEISQSGSLEFAPTISFLLISNGQHEVEYLQYLSSTIQQCDVQLLNVQPQSTTRRDKRHKTFTLDV